MSVGDIINACLYLFLGCVLLLYFSMILQNASEFAEYYISLLGMIYSAIIIILDYAYLIEAIVDGGNKNG